jgi:hypothetical protein
MPRGITIRKKNAEKTKKMLIKIFGGLNCGNYDTQKNRRECNDLVRKNIDISKKHTKCDIDNYKIKFNDISIILGKLIGKGQYGKAFLSVFKYKNESYDIIIKQQNINDKNMENIVNKELAIIQFLSTLIQKNVSPHFLHYYNEVYCDVNQIVGGKPLETPSTMIANQAPSTMIANQAPSTMIANQAPSTMIANQAPSSIVVNNISSSNNNRFNKYIKTFIIEKASGALSELKFKIESDFNSIITQIIISIYTFHQYTKCYHCDTHYNNFLYHELMQQKNTYIKYKLDNNLYKLKLSKYLIILWDYGIAQTMQNSGILYNYEPYNNNLYFTYMIYDYYRIFNIINNNTYFNINNVNKKNMLYNIIKILVNYNDKIKKELQQINNHNKRVIRMLQIEKEMIYNLIKERILFTDDVSSYESYNGIAYDLENNANYNMPKFSENNYKHPNEKLNTEMPHYLKNMFNINASNSYNVKTDPPNAYYIKTYT